MEKSFFFTSKELGRFNSINLTFSWSTSERWSRKKFGPYENFQASLSHNLILGPIILVNLKIMASYFHNLDLIRKFFCFLFDVDFNSSFTFAAVVQDIMSCAQMGATALNFQSSRPFLNHLFVIWMQRYQSQTSWSIILTISEPSPWNLGKDATLKQVGI